jgi:hypothetical protein
MVRRLVLPIVILGLNAFPLFARTFYMSNSGTDTAAGSLSAPWSTLAKANSTMAAGDTLCLRGSVYSGVSGIQWTKSGTLNSPVVIAALPGEHPAFNGNGANWLLLISGQYVIIDGLEVTNYGTWAFQVAGNSSYVTIRNCYLHNILAAENAAIVTRQCDHITIENCVLEEMGRSLTQTSFDHAVYNSDGSHDITIRNNYFKNNYGGPAINHYHEPSPYNIYIYNNVFLMTKGAERSGVYVGDSAHNVYLYNNTFYLDGTAATTGYGITLNSGVGTNVAENNIFYFINWSIQNALIGTSGNAVDYDLYYPTKDSDDNGTHSKAGDPLFKTNGSDFHLTELSVARKSAVTISLFNDDFDGAPRPAGAWDIGAFQYDAGAAILERNGGPRSVSQNRFFSITLLSREKILIVPNCSPSIERNSFLRIFSLRGVLIDLIQRDGKGFMWDNRSHARGILVLQIGSSQIGISQQVFIP